MSTWLDEREQGFRDRVEVVTMDGFVAYQHLKKAEGKKLMRTVISTLRSSTMPKGLDEINQLGNTLYRRQKDVLAYFDIGVSNGPV